jgi:CheY-like chemotaxis protein
MPEGGRLHFLLSRFHAEESVPGLASGTLPAGQWLRIDVSDTGSGIKAEDLPHLFEPFFTTKGIGQGSGLGLAQVFGLVKQHQGEIAVQSEVGKGATFSIYLPVSNTAPAVYDAPETATVPQGHGETVLVVEDSDFLRAALVSVLTQLGYKTVAASNGQEAFDHIIRDADNINVILSDLSMPIMGGKELIRALRAQGWEHPVIILSGQPLSQPEIVQLESYGRVSRLQKPAVMDRLALTLHQTIYPPAESHTE